MRISTETIAKNLRTGMDASGITQASLAKAVGVTPAVVWQWVNGRRPVPLRYVQHVSTLLALHPSDISFEYSQMLDRAQDDVAGRTLIPASPIQTNEDELVIPSWRPDDPGFGPLLVDADPPVSVPPSWLSKRRLPLTKLRSLDIQGDAMRPTLSDGDLVIVNLADTRLVDGRIYAFALGEELKVRRLRRRADGAIVIMSDNPDSVTYPDEVVDPEEGTLLGRVVQRRGDL
jgi:transcriptional regulator with XRE-family HTH domain